MRRLQEPVRKRARWDRTLSVLERAKAYAAEYGNEVHTKSSLMVGLGETREELTEGFVALRAVDCDILTIGQYLRPTIDHLALERYYHPDEFADMKDEALALGFRHVESGPLVRSSYHARDQVPGAELRNLAPRPWTRTAASSRRPGRAREPPSRTISTTSPSSTMCARPDDLAVEPGRGAPDATGRERRAELLVHGCRHMGHGRPGSAAASSSTSPARRRRTADQPGQRPDGRPERLE